MSVSNAVYESALARIDALERERDAEHATASNWYRMYEHERAENERLTRERDVARTQLDSQTVNAGEFLMQRDAAEAENERLRAALTAAEQAAAAEAQLADEYRSRLIAAKTVMPDWTAEGWNQFIDAALAGGVGARWKERKARVLCQRSKAPVGYTGPICSCGAMECAAGGVGDTAAPRCESCGRRLGTTDEWEWYPESRLDELCWAEPGACVGDTAA